MKAGVLPKIELPKVENPDILGGQCSVSLLETLSRKPESVVKLPPEVLNLTGGIWYGKVRRVDPENFESRSCQSLCNEGRG